MAIKKGEIRAHIKEQLQRANQEGLDLQSRRICAAISESDYWKKALVVLTYYPLPMEVDLRPLFALALEEGKEVFLPRMEGKTMAFYPYTGEDHLEINSWGIKEPLTEEDPWYKKPSNPALILIPGRAFDLQGGRLGRGGGFYDRWFNTRAKEGQIPFLAGVCFQEQVVSRVPMESFDKSLDALFCDKQSYFFT